jgi:pimeloyl-ACP methyl ester carboxylesterase
MAAYLSFVDKELPVEQKVALAISGWVQGSDGAVDQLTVALSLYDVRKLIHEYFNAPNTLERKLTLEKIRKQEGGTPGNLAKLLAYMKPPVDTPQQTTEGYYTLTAPGITGEAGFSYLVQLPPEYDPHRKYPAIISLHGSSTTPEQQVDWWAGGLNDKGRRQGQATRHGYIVIAPAWGEEHQNEYKFSGREHLAVLSTLRDASRRFSIDTDRVFLSGHSMGGSAAWDIAVAHPDLWAGVIPIAARSDKYTDIYWKNARYVPMYVVGGELDGGWLAQSSISLQRYLRAANPLVIVEFLGRGHEHFGDEVIEIFDWMALFRRDFNRKDFTCYTLRPWDNYFWFAEMQGIPDSAVVLPEDFATAKSKRPFMIEGEIKGNNNLFFRGGAEKVTLWLSPERIDFGSPSTFIVNGKRFTFPNDRISGDVETLLEDVRTRGDRQHPFWARITFPEGVLNAGLSGERPTVKRGKTR